MPSERTWERWDRFGELDSHYFIGVFHPHWPSPNVLSLPIQLGETWLDRCPAELGNVSNARGLSRKRRRLIQNPSSLGSWFRIPRLETIDSRALFVNVALALWLAKPSHGSPILIAHAGHDDSSDEDHGWMVHCWRSLPQLRPHPSYHTTRLEATDLELASQYMLRLKGLQPEGAVEIALQLLWMALTDLWWPGRLLVLWTAIEGLFASSSPGETIYRLTHRLALFIADNAQECEALLHEVPKLYAIRSRTVHGFRIQNIKQEVRDKVTLRTEELLRRSLSKIIVRDDYVTLFSGRGREEFLDGLLVHRTW
jgi:hypothetical protein